MSKLLNWLLSITFHKNIDFSSGYWITDIMKWILGTTELNFLLNSMFSWPFCLGSTESTQWGRLCCPHFTPHLFPLVRHARSYGIFTKLKVPEKLYLFVFFCTVCHIKKLNIKKAVQHCSFLRTVLNLVSNVWQDKLVSRGVLNFPGCQLECLAETFGTRLSWLKNLFCYQPLKSAKAQIILSSQKNRTNEYPKTF